MTTVPYSPSASDAITAAQYVANNAALAAAIDSLDANNLADNAGILSTHLADRYALSEILIPLAGLGADANNCPTAATVVGRTKVRLGSGRRGWVYRVEIYCYAVTADSGAYPRCTVVVSGVTIGGSYKDILVSDNIYLNGNSSDVADPLVPVANNDDITVSLQADTGSGNPSLENAWVRIFLKTEITS